MVAVCIHHNYEHILNLINHLGVYSFVGFLLLYSIISVFCLPIALIALAGGAIFGPIFGSLLNLIGAAIAATCGFYLSRFFRPKKYQTIKNIRIQKIIKEADSVGWKSVAILRLTPAPFHFVNYSLGLTKIDFPQFLITSTIFLIPKTVILTCGGFYGSYFLKDVKIENIWQHIQSWF